MKCFFFDAVWPRIEIDEGTPRVTLPDEEYPGDRQEWIEGFETYMEGFPLADCDLDGHQGRRSPMEVSSFVHGFMTARMAEAMAAEVPDELPGHGEEVPDMDGARLALDY